MPDDYFKDLERSQFIETSIDNKLLYIFERIRLLADEVEKLKQFLEPPATDTGG